MMPGSISSKKNEPEWLLEFRLKAYRHWLTLEMPTWAHLRIPEIDYQAISYYADPTKKKEGPKSMDEVDRSRIRITVLDLLVAAYLTWGVFNLWLIRPDWPSLRFWSEWIFLVCTYLAARLFFTDRQKVLAGFIVISGVAQSLWGIMQAIRVLPPGHEYFAATGAFPNPGPWGGYVSISLISCIMTIIDAKKGKNAQVFLYPIDPAGRSGLDGDRRRFRMARFPGCGWYHRRSGGSNRIRSSDGDSLPVLICPGGLRIHGESCVYHGPYFPQIRIIGKELYPAAYLFRLRRSGDHGH